MGKKLIYKKEDFNILSGDNTGDIRIAYVFESKDGKVTANFFFEPGNVQVRGLISGKGDIIGTIHIVYPLLNPVGDPRKLPDASEILNSIISKLKRGEYE